MAAKLIPLIAAVLGVDPATIDDDSDATTQPRWDSAAEVELAMMLEHEFGISIGEREMETLISVRAIRATLAKHGVTPD